MNTEQTAQLDADSFAELFEVARGTLRVVAAAECGFDLADDIVQHSAIIALERLDQFTPGTNFSAWTAKIVQGVARNARRSEHRRRSRNSRFARQSKATPPKTDFLPKTSQVGVRAGAAGPEIQLPSDLDANLLRAIESLGQSQRICLLLRVLLDHSYVDIGGILNMPAATARSHVYRARTALLNELQSVHQEGGPL